MSIHGLLGKKIGMTQIFLENGRVENVTAIQVGPCLVTQIKSKDKDGYESVQLGFEPTRKMNKPQSGHLRKTGQTETTFRVLREFKADDYEELEIGQEINVGLFETGDRVDNLEGQGGIQVVKATLPLGESFGYASALRSLTQGRASYSMEFESYEVAPESVVAAS